MTKTNASSKMVKLFGRRICRLMGWLDVRLIMLPCPAAQSTAVDEEIAITILVEINIAGKGGVANHNHFPIGGRVLGGSCNRQWAGEVDG